MIIAISGPLGAGKGTVAEYLRSEHHYLYISVRSFFAEEVLKLGQAATRENISAVARALRAEKGPTYAIEQLLMRAGRGGHGIVMESVRTIAEAELVKSKGGALWYVEADLETRYKRFTGKALPQDALTFEQFAESDKKDMDQSDPTNQDLPALKQLAAATINNNGTKEELKVQIEDALKKLWSTSGK